MVKVLLRKCFVCSKDLNRWKDEYVSKGNNYVHLRCAGLVK